MDDIDRQLLDLIQADSAMSYASLGKHIGLSISAVNERVRKLERQNVISHYGAIIDADALGFAVTAFVRARAPKGGLAADLDRQPLILECHRISGDADYLIKLRCHAHKQLQDFVDQVLVSEFGLTIADLSITLSTQKETLSIPCANDRQTAATS